MKINPKDYRPEFLKKRLEQEEAEAKNPRKCRMCPTPLLPWLKYYCSAMCIQTARADGSYGNEENGGISMTEGPVPPSVPF
jgi:hypothetical protein